MKRVIAALALSLLWGCSEKGSSDMDLRANGLQQGAVEGACFTKVKADLPPETPGLKMLYSQAYLEVRPDRGCSETGLGIFLKLRSWHPELLDRRECAQRVGQKGQGGFLVHFDQKDPNTNCPLFGWQEGGEVRLAHWSTPESRDQYVRKCVREEYLRRCLRHVEVVRRCLREEYAAGCSGCGGYERVNRCLNEEYIRYCIKEQYVKVCSQEALVRMEPREDEAYSRFCRCYKEQDRGNLNVPQPE